MSKIVVTNNQNFTPEQKQRLDGLGDVTYYDAVPKSAKEYLERIKGADIICSGTAGFKNAYPQMKDVYVTVGFASVAFLDLEVLNKNNVTLSNAPGANRHAVSEWIMGMMIILMRDLHDNINRTETLRPNGSLPPLTSGLAERNLTILGKGNIGRRVGTLAEAFGMNVRYFTRGDDLAESVKGADVVVDTLSSNQSTHKLLDDTFFSAMKHGSRLVTITRSEVVDEAAMLRALDEGRLAGVASDCGGIMVGDTEDSYYQKLRNHPKVLVTPHIAYNTGMSMRVGSDIMINNVEAYIKGKSINVVTK